MLLFWCFWSLLRWAGSAFRQTLLFPELASKGPHVGRKREVELREWGGGCYLSWDQAELFKGPKRHYFYRARQGWVEFSEKQGFTPGISCPEFGRWMRLLQDSVEGKSALALRKGKKKKKERTNSTSGTRSERKERRQVSPYPQRLGCPWGGGGRSRLSA